MKKRIWLPEQDEFIKKNYSTKGKDYCSRILNVGSGIVYLRAKQFGIKSARGNIYNIDYIKNICLPEVAYILGFLWADGSISDINKKQYNLGIEANKKDLDEIEWVFDKTNIPWKKYYNQYKVKIHPTWQEGRVFKTSHKDLCFYLTKNDYRIKSRTTPSKILSSIPKKLQHYFFRGWSDGDGCFYYGEKYKGRMFCIYGTALQDWTCLESLCMRLKISKPNTKRMIVDETINKGGSHFYLLRKDDIQKLGNYIYRNYEQDKIGLDRKYQKFLQTVK